MLLAILCLGTSLYHLISPGPYKMGMLAFYYLFPAALVLFGVGFLIQYSTSSYSRAILCEITLIVLVAIGYTWQNRTKTYVLPGQGDLEYIAVVYGIENGSELPLHWWTRSYEIRIPESGIILTSAEVNDDFPKTRFVQPSKSKAEISGVFADASRIHIGNDSFECHIWMISQDDSISYGSNDIEKIQEDLRKHLNGLKNIPNNK